MMRLFLLVAFMVLAQNAAAAVGIPVPIATDSRIKTLVYNENDVFSILTHYGYQCNIEFGFGEEIQTLSLGDRVGWQVIPSGRRVFIRSMEDSSRTNMTVVTNRHTYQFDLKSAPISQNPEEELVYVVRFFYPDEEKDRIGPAPYSDAPAAPAPTYAPPPMMPQQPAAPYGYAPTYAPPPAYNYAPQPAYNYAPPQAPAYSYAPPPPSAAPAAPAYPATSATPAAYNYDYTYTGPDALAPLQLFDDGRSTYFKFANPQLVPMITRVGQDGKETALKASLSGGYVVVEGVNARLSVRSDNNVLCVYNEGYR